MGSDSKQVLAHIEAFGFSQCPSKSKRESHSERYLFSLWVNMHDWMTLQITITCRYICSSEQLELIPTKQWSTGEARCTQRPKNWTQGGALWLRCAWFLLLVDHTAFELSPSSNLRSIWPWSVGRKADLHSMTWPSLSPPVGVPIESPDTLRRTALWMGCICLWFLSVTWERTVTWESE